MTPLQSPLRRVVLIACVALFPCATAWSQAGENAAYGAPFDAAAAWSSSMCSSTFWHSTRPHSPGVAARDGASGSASQAIVTRGSAPKRPSRWSHSRSSISTRCRRSTPAASSRSVNVPTPGPTSMTAGATESANWSNIGRSPHRIRRLTVGDDGRFSAVGLPTGEYYLVAVRDPDRLDERNPRQLQTLAAVADRIVITQGDMRSVTLRIKEVR